MKLVALLFATLLAVPAHAEDMQRQQRRGAFKQALLQQFDRDGDGRLNPRERMHAARVLARIQQKLAGREGRHSMRGREMRGQQRDMRRLRREQRREQRLEQRDMRGEVGPDTDTQVDVYVR